MWMFLYVRVHAEVETAIKKTIAMEKTGAVSKQVVHKIIIMKIEKHETKKREQSFACCEYGSTLLFCVHIKFSMNV